MGLQFHSNLRKAKYKTTTMKAFTTIALAAAASAAPEAHHQFFGQPLVYSQGGMVHHSNGAVVPDDTFAVKAAKVEHLTAKAKTYLSKPVVGLVHSLAATPVAQTIASPVVSSYSGLYNPYLYNTHLIKREAEAEADSQVLLNTPYTGYNTMYNGAFSGVFNYPKAAVTYTTGAVTPMVVNFAVSAPIYSGLNGYSLYGNTHHLIAKREAEAEAEAEAEPQFMFRAPYTTHPINYQQPIYNYMSPMMTPFIGAHHLI